MQQGGTLWALCSGTAAWALRSCACGAQCGLVITCSSGPPAVLCLAWVPCSLLPQGQLVKSPCTATAPTSCVTSDADTVAGNSWRKCFAWGARTTYVAHFGPFSGYSTTAAQRTSTYSRVVRRYPYLLFSRSASAVDPAIAVIAVPAPLGGIQRIGVSIGTSTFVITRDTTAYTMYSPSGTSRLESVAASASLEYVSWAAGIAVQHTTTAFRGTHVQVSSWTPYSPASSTGSGNSPFTLTVLRPAVGGLQVTIAYASPTGVEPGGMCRNDVAASQFAEVCVDYNGVSADTYGCGYTVNVANTSYAWLTSGAPAASTTALLPYDALEACNFNAALTPVADAACAVFAFQPALYDSCRFDWCATSPAPAPAAPRWRFGEETSSAVLVFRDILSLMDSRVAFWPSSCDIGTPPASATTYSNEAGRPKTPLTSLWTIEEQGGKLVFASNRPSNDVRITFHPGSTVDFGDASTAGPVWWMGPVVTIWRGVRWAVQSEGGVLVIRDTLSAGDKRVAFFGYSDVRYNVPSVGAPVAMSAAMTLPAVLYPPLPTGVSPPCGFWSSYQGTQCVCRSAVETLAGASQACGTASVDRRYYFDVATRTRNNVSPGYYSTPEDQSPSSPPATPPTQRKLGQSQCEIGHYCVDGLRVSGCAKWRCVVRVS
jgi:hypothetical protein